MAIDPIKESLKRSKERRRKKKSNGLNPSPIKDIYQRRRNILIGSLGAIALGGAFILGSYSGRNGVTLESSLAHAATQEVTNDEYKALTGLVGNHLTKHPEYANGLIQQGIGVVNNNDDVSFTPQSYMSMFKVVKERAEEKPELTNHLGPKAKSHLIESALKEQYKEMEKEGKTILEYSKDKLDGMVEGAKDYLRKKL